MPFLTSLSWLGDLFFERGWGSPVAPLVPELIVKS